MSKIPEINGWALAKNVHHESGSPTYAKKDKHGFTTYATLEMLQNTCCQICSRIIDEEAHYCEISDCPHKIEQP